MCQLSNEDHVVIHEREGGRHPDRFHLPHHLAGLEVGGGGERRRETLLLLIVTVHLPHHLAGLEVGGGGLGFWGQGVGVSGEGLGFNI